jgi:hypothetical protein
MRKSSILLAFSLVGVFSGTVWWLVRADSENIAIPEHGTAEHPGTLANNSIPGNSPAAQATPPAQSATATAVPSTAAAAVPAKLAATASKPQWILRDEDLARARAIHEADEIRRSADPAYRKAQEDSRRRDAGQIRADAIRVARMTPEQADRMVEFAAERAAGMHELIATSHGRTADEVSADASRLRADYDAQLRELLEPDKYERWDWYHASQSERIEARQFQAELTSNGGEPLQLDQVDLLVEALYTEEKRRSSEYEQYVRSTGIAHPDKVPPRSNEWQLARGKASNKRVHDAMAGALTPDQVSSLDKMLARKLDYIEEAIRYNASHPKTK